jgi:hypothetical protein
MSGFMRNSEWEKRFAGHATVRELLVQVCGGQLAIEQFMKRYKALVFDYLHWFLLRHKAVANEKACSEAAERIWARLMAALPGKITDEWSKGKIPFRELLREAVHAAYFTWSHPDRGEAAVMARLAAASDHDAAWLGASRSDVLAKARERLKSYQREHESRKNVYYTLFCVWDEDHGQPHDAINNRLATVKGGRQLSPENFRQSFRRTIDTFGRYLGEAVGDLIASRQPVTAEHYQQAFEELDLMEYAMESQYCRYLMGLDMDV